MYYVNPNKCNIDLVVSYASCGVFLLIRVYRDPYNALIVIAIILSGKFNNVQLDQISHLLVEKYQNKLV